MSVHVIYYKDGAKMMRPVETRESYLKLRGSKKQKATLVAVREGDEGQKTKLLQMNYSCLPGEDGRLKGSTRMSGSVGMDIDHIGAEEMEAVKERILGKKEELGLLMLERSARGQGYHLVFRRHKGLSQEENLRWASELLEVEFDKGAKDITRVFFTTTDEAEELLFLDDEIFGNSANTEIENPELKSGTVDSWDSSVGHTPSVGGHTPPALRATSPNLGEELGGASVAALQCCSSSGDTPSVGGHTPPALRATSPNFAPLRSQAVSPTEPGRGGELKDGNLRGTPPCEGGEFKTDAGTVFGNGELGEFNEATQVNCGRITRKEAAGKPLDTLERGENATVLQCYSSVGHTPLAGGGHTSPALRATSPNIGEELAGAVTPPQSYPLEYKGFAYSDILRKYWELFNDGKEPTEGDRDTLTYQLACDLRHICGRNAEWLDQVIPCYDGFPLEEKRQKIQNALSAKSEGMPYRLKQVLAALKSTVAVKACGGTQTTPPPLPKKLPPLVKLLTKNVPDAYRPAVASAIFPSLGAHLHGTKFRYWDNVEHEATFMNVLIGRQSTGKSCIKKPIEYIMEDIRQRDIPNRQREAEWKQKNPGARQKKDPRPTDICIQMLIDNLTDAVFNQRIVDANNNGERFLYTIVDEIDALKKVTSKGTTDEVGLLIRKAFDNSMAGQERVGADSVSGIAPLRWNFNASTTPPNARKFLWKMVNDGTLSRLDLSTIIMAEGDEDEVPVMGIYDDQFAQELKPYIDRLEAASGLIECPQAKKLALEMREENRDIAQLYDSEAYRIFSYRANVIAWLKGMVMYVAQGYKWTKETAEFVRWSEQYNLWCKMLYFGQQLEEELREEIKLQSQSGPQNLLELLPDEFGREEYRLMRERQGKSGDGNGTLRVWVKRGYLFRDEVTGRYCKTESYLKKFRDNR